MTTYTLTTFQDGDTLLASEMNDNFQYCLADTTSKVGALSSTVSSGYVKTTTAQSIAGGKTFTDTPTVLRSPSYLNLENPDIDLGSTPSANKYCGVVFKDKDGDTIGQVYHRRQADQTIATIMTCFNKAGSSNVSLTVGYDASGNAISAAPACNANNSIVTTTAHSFGTNGYVKLGNGLIVQWGKSDVQYAETNFSVTFPTAFTAAPSVTCDCSTTVGDLGEIITYLGTISTTGFNCRFARTHGSGSDGGQCSWVAIGY